MLLAVAHLVLTFWFRAPGALLSDEAIYHWMAKGFSDTYSFTVWNGYEEFPSPELQHKYIRPHLGELNPQYPPLFTMLALPFYRLFGFFGLFVMNAFAFVGVVALCFLIARKLFNDTDLALNSCLILTLGTFAWEYSQAAWPHIFALLFLMAAFYLSVCAYAAHTKRAALLSALASGCVGALGLGVRLDNVLVFPALILPFLFAKKPRLREALAIAIGAVPPLVLLAWANSVRFGDFNPFSYGEGPGVQTISPWMVVALFTVALITWIVTRPGFLDLSTRNRVIAWGAAGLGVLISLTLVPEVMEIIGSVLRDGYVCAVDVRALPADSPVAPRSSGGGVLYIGAHKKALLQSLPYLPLLLVPVLGMVRGGQDFRALATLFLPVIAVIGFYSFSFPFHDMGGLCLNTRYFIPCLPFIAILSAYGIKDLEVRWRAAAAGMSGCRGGTFCKKSFPGPLPKNSYAFMSWQAVTMLASVSLAAVFFALTQKLHIGLDALEFPLLALPLYMALLLLILIVCGLLVKSPWVRFIRSGAWMVLIGAMAWAGLVAFWYDYPAHRFVRVVHAAYGKKLLESISTDSIVFADNKTFTVAMTAIEKPQARVAFPSGDGFQDFSRLLDFQLKAKRRAFAFFHDALWTDLKGGLLSRYRITPLVVFDGFTLAEITAPADVLQKDKTAER